MGKTERQRESLLVGARTVRGEVRYAKPGTGSVTVGFSVKLDDTGGEAIVDWSFPPFPSLSFHACFSSQALMSRSTRMPSGSFSVSCIMPA
jgi:hypothetical protein